MRKIPGLTLVLWFGLLSWLLPCRVDAIPVEWSVNATFDDGGILSGSFTYDADDDELSAWSLSTSAGAIAALTPFVYTPITSTYLNDILGFHDDRSFIFCANSCDGPDFGNPFGRRRDLRFQFETVLTSAGGVIAMLPGEVGGTFGLECFNCVPFRTLTSGHAEVLIPVPEPATATLTVLGLALGLGARFVRPSWRNI